MEVARRLAEGDVREPFRCLPVGMLATNLDTGSS
jgi:hypothetical protein